MREGLGRRSSECEIHLSLRGSSWVLYDVCIFSLYVFCVCCSRVSMLACCAGCACLGGFLGLTSTYLCAADAEKTHTDSEETDEEIVDDDGDEDEDGWGSVDEVTCRSVAKYIYARMCIHVLVACTHSLHAYIDMRSADEVTCRCLAGASATHDHHHHSSHSYHYRRHRRHHLSLSLCHYPHQLERSKRASASVLLLYTTLDYKYGHRSSIIFTFRDPGWSGGRAPLLARGMTLVFFIADGDLRELRAGMGYAEKLK